MKAQNTWEEFSAMKYTLEQLIVMSFLAHLMP